MDHTVTFEVSVTASSPEEAARLALSDLRDTSLGPWNAQVSGGGAKVDVQVSGLADGAAAVPSLRLLQGPQVSNPVNAEGGLYMLVVRERKTPLSAFTARLKELARQHGFNPEGRSTTGAPGEHGFGTVTNAVWFHERLRK